MSEIILGRCAPDVLLSHLALYGIAAILDAEGITGVRAAWTQDSDQRPVISAPGLTGEQAAEAIAGHARRANDAASWLHRPITLKGSSRALMSPASPPSPTRRPGTTPSSSGTRSSTN